MVVNGKERDARLHPCFRLRFAFLFTAFLHIRLIFTPHAPSTQTLSQALNISGINKFQPISKSAFEKLYARKFVAGNAVGAALAFGPTAYMDMKSAGGVGAIVNKPAARK